MAGLLPGVGAVPDAINAGLYAVEGDYGNAALSAAAAIPGIGDGATATKYAAKYGDDVIGVVAKTADDAVGAVCSFSEDTPVLTEEGSTPIGDLVEGDTVLAFNEATGTTSMYPVTTVWLHRDPQIVHLTLDDETLETTPEHPFFVEGKGWVAAGELALGDRVRRVDGTIGAVTKVVVEQRDQVMYNLEVGTAHTFFVGEEGWLVHNACKLDKNLGGVVGDQKQAHHLIPQERKNHPFVQQATRGGWDHDAATNGVLLPDNVAGSIAQNVPYHNGSHANYSNNVLTDLNRLAGAFRANGWNDQQARRVLTKYADQKRTTILNSGGGQRIQ